MTKLILLTAISLTLSPAWGQNKVIYGKDNRKDVYETLNVVHKKLSRSSAGMIHIGMFTKGEKPKTFDLKYTDSLERSQNICASEKFSQQPTAPNCSGFLVSEDTLVTAGHCYEGREDTPENICKKFAWVFGYEMTSATSDPTKGIALENIYLCKQVVKVELNATMDYAIIKLDRKVVGREPLKFRTSGKISSPTPLLVIGHPTGLPTKIADGGKITKNSEETRFSTTLDTFHGNSGSAVFDAKTGQVEGILIMGKNDYLPSIASNPKSCLVVNTCKESGNACSAGKETGPVASGEVVLRIEKIANEIAKAI
jgi:V8-like Glu-specific endopeptidase